MEGRLAAAIRGQCGGRSTCDATTRRLRTMPGRAADGGDTVAADGGHMRPAQGALGCDGQTPRGGLNNGPGDS
eukprot:5059970-Prymnesium_polylepis.1